MPSHKNKDEYILWLAGFIERMTTGGETHLPPISKFIPPDFKFNCEFDSGHTQPVEVQRHDEGELIINYFKSEPFMKIISVHDKFHRTLILSGFCLLKIAKISLNSSFFPKPIKR
ncbi:hypothetical protein ACINWC487_A0112 [Acinetobacter nosocomialis]|nr:hypothetical protein ACINWC487_A0112 [Acinetobacter nosocomialis]